jgi:cytoskeletal protein RodZ
MDFGTYLRSARESRRLTLDEISRTTKIKRDLLVDLERNSVAKWPRHRVYRHGYVRAYAKAVGLDPATVLKRFDEEFGDPHPAAFHGPPRRPGVQRPAPRTFRFASNALVTASVAVVVGALIGMLAAIGQRNGDERGAPRRYGVPGVVASQVQPSNDVIPPMLMAGTAGPTVVTPPASTETNASEAPPPQQVASVVTPAVEDDVLPDENDEIEGELRITSTPPQAHVTINGIGRGPTPLRVRYLPPGTYAVRVILAGYRIRETRVVLSREQPVQSVRITLREAPAFASAAFHAPAQQP